MTRHWNQTLPALLLAVALLLAYEIFISKQCTHAEPVIQEVYRQDKLMSLLDGNEDTTGKDLVELIKQRFLWYPAKSPTQLTNGNASVNQHTDYSQHKQSTYVDKLLKGKRGGFFVECGALDGEFLSNTLFLERARDWTGLLIEANPVYFPSLVRKNRNAFVLHAALSTENKTMISRFSMLNNPTGSHLSEFDGILEQRTGAGVKVDVPSFPIYSVMLALGRTHIDFFSLDVEGAEVPILMTIPFDKLYIDLMIIEIGGGRLKPWQVKRLKDIRQIMADTKLYTEVGIFGIDITFKRK